MSRFDMRNDSCCGRDSGSIERLSESRRFPIPSSKAVVVDQTAMPALVAAVLMTSSTSGDRAWAKPVVAARKFATASYVAAPATIASKRPTTSPTVPSLAHIGEEV